MKKIILIAIFLSGLGYAQEKISMQIIQDAKLGIVGDKEHGYDSGTIDMAFSVMMQGKQKKYGGSLSYGFIDRGLTDFCWGTNGFIKYKLCNSFKIVANMQLTQRPDLKTLYGSSNEWRYSGQLGIEISLFKQVSRNKKPYNNN